MPVSGSLFVRLGAFLRLLLAGAAVVTGILLLLCAYSPWLSPDSFPRLALLGMLFPVFVVVNVVVLVFWLIFHVRYALMPFTALLLSAPVLWDYCPLNWPSSPKDDCLKVLTYNVLGFHDARSRKASHEEILDYLSGSGADVILLQEAYASKEMSVKKLDRTLRSWGYYTLHPANVAVSANLCYSKYPVLSAEQIPYREDAANGSVAYRILYAPGDTLLVVNNHLQSYHFSTDEREAYQKMLASPERKTLKSSTRILARRMKEALQERAPEVQTVLDYMARSGCKSIIAGGDFNDTPVSYVYRRFSEQLTNAFEQSGTGLGWSFNQRGFYVRIDHLFFSDDWTSCASTVDKRISVSDHYPHYTYLRRNTARP